MRAIDLAQEPISLSVTEDVASGRVGLSDLPEQVLPALRQSYGDEVIRSLIEKSPTERMYFSRLPAEPPRRPRFLELFESGELEQRARRIEGNGTGGPEVPYFMAAINHSDEAILGRTGVVYFVCRKGCHFCQYRNFAERTLDAEGIAERMLALQEAGADNVQWLSPTAYTRTLVKALFLAAQAGFRLPIVHKSEGEDPLPDLQLLDGLVDVYLPDVKFVRPEFAPLVGLSPSYAERAKACIAEMIRQVGPLRRASGARLMCTRGVMVRHLLMPAGVEEAKEVMLFIKGFGVEVPIEIMTNYRPLHDARKVPAIYRSVTNAEVAEVVQLAHSLEVPRVFVK